MKRVVAAIFLSQLAVAAAFAQSGEFGHATGGAIDLMAKHSAPLSGSFAITTSRGIGATLGGEIVRDRLWFFASAEKSHSVFASTPVFVGKMVTLIDDRENLAASFASTKSPTVPSSFLSLHYTGIVSSNMFFTASFSGLRRTN